MQFLTLTYYVDWKNDVRVIVGQTAHYIYVDGNTDNWFFEATQMGV